MRATRILYAIMLVFLLPLAARANDGNPSRPKRIVSINLCADQYLLALADSGQIAALTRFARDPSISFHAARAGAFPVVPTSAEAIMELQPDLVLASRYRDAETKTMLRRFGFKIVELDRAETVLRMIEQTREMAALIGREQRGEDIVAALKATARPHDGTRTLPTALAYQRKGYVSGSGTIVAEMMRLAGATNQAEKMGRSAVSRVSLEEIALDPPDYLVIEDMSGQPRDIGTDLLRHPVLHRLFSDNRIIYMPSALTVCGGPSFPAAVETFRRAIAGR